MKHVFNLPMFLPSLVCCTLAASRVFDLAMKHNNILCAVASVRCNKHRLYIFSKLNLEQR